MTFRNMKKLLLLLALSVAACGCKPSISPSRTPTVTASSNESAIGPVETNVVSQDNAGASGDSAIVRDEAINAERMREAGNQPATAKAAHPVLGAFGWLFGEKASMDYNVEKNPNKKEPETFVLHDDGNDSTPHFYNVRISCFKDGTVYAVAATVSARYKAAVIAALKQKYGEPYFDGSDDKDFYDWTVDNCSVLAFFGDMLGNRFLTFATRPRSRKTRAACSQLLASLKCRTMLEPSATPNGIDTA